MTEPMTGTTMQDQFTQQAASSPSIPPSAPGPELLAIEAQIEQALGAVTAERDALTQRVAQLESDLGAKVEAAEAAGQQALEDLRAQMRPILEAVVAERDALKARLGQAVVGAVEPVTATVFKDVEEEAAHLRNEITTAVETAKAKANRLADISVGTARHGAERVMGFLQSVGGTIAQHL